MVKYSMQQSAVYFRNRYWSDLDFREKHLKKNAEFREKHPEYQQDWRDKNREHYNAYMREYMKKRRKAK